MEQQQADHLIMAYGSYLPSETLPYIHTSLLNMDYNSAMLRMTQFKDPTTAIILSILVGFFGVDRFYIGDTGLGVGKLLTCGGIYVWWFVDLFLIMDATKQKNYRMLMM